jgi:hypothetical protein
MISIGADGKKMIKPGGPVFLKDNCLFGLKRRLWTIRDMRGKDEDESVGVIVRVAEISWDSDSTQF